MSNAIRRINKQMAKPMAITDTKIAFNGCKVLLGNTNPSVAVKAAAQFGGFMQMLNDRARQPNFGDLYREHFKTLAKIEAGEEVVEEKTE